MMNEIKKITAYKYHGETRYIIDYMNGETVEKNAETFYEGEIISESVKHRSFKTHKAHNGGFTEYFNPKYYLFSDI